MNTFDLAIKGLFRKKLRAALLLASIAIAFAIFGTLAGFLSVLNSGRDSPAAKRLVVLNKINFTQPLPLSYYTRMSALKDVNLLTHLSWFGGYYQDPKELINVFAVEPGSYLDLYDSTIDVPENAKKIFLADKATALVGDGLIRKWGWAVGDHIPISSNIFSKSGGSRTWDFTIAGIFRGRSSNLPTDFMLIRYDYFDTTRSFMKNRIGWIALNAKPSVEPDRLASEIDRLFANSPDETSTQSEKVFNDAFSQQFGNIALVVLWVVGAAFATNLMIVGNTMLMAIRERTLEIAVLKTLGFSRRRILLMILSETILLAVLGGIIGMLVAAIAALQLNQALPGFMRRATMTPEVVGVALCLMLLLGLVTGLVPALNAMRIKIAEALGRT